MSFPWPSLMVILLSSPAKARRPPRLQAPARMRLLCLPGTVSCTRREGRRRLRGRERLRATHVRKGSRGRDCLKERPGWAAQGDFWYLAPALGVVDEHVSPAIPDCAQGWKEKAEMSCALGAQRPASSVSVGDFASGDVLTHHRVFSPPLPILRSIDPAQIAKDSTTECTDSLASLQVLVDHTSLTGPDFAIL